MRASATAFAVPTPFSDVTAGFGSSRIGAASHPSSAAAVAGLAIAAGRGVVCAYAEAARQSVNARQSETSPIRRGMNCFLPLSGQAWTRVRALLRKLFGPIGIDQLQRDDDVLQPVAAQV